MLTNEDLERIDALFSKQTKPIKEDIASIRKDMKTIVGFFDNEYLELRKRVEKIEEHLNLQSSN